LNFPINFFSLFLCLLIHCEMEKIRSALFKANLFIEYMKLLK
jgi:hypothetical protein